MVDPRNLELFAAGILNGTPFVAQGTLDVDTDAGTKDGCIEYQSLPVTLNVGIASVLTMTGRCFVGAKHVGRRPFVGPLELLGRDFVSLRTTTVGRYGSVSASERGRFAGSSLRCEICTVAGLRPHSAIRVGPLREVITVTGPDTLVAQGRYSHRTASGRAIPARYTQYYRSLQPNRPLFQRLQGRKYILDVRFASTVSGKKLTHRTQSVLRLASDS